MTKQFFQQPEVKALLRQAQLRLDSLNQDAKNEKLRLLTKSLVIIHENAEAFDEACQINIEWIGDHLRKLLERASSKDVSEAEIDDLYGAIYRYAVEFDLSIKNELSLDLRRFQSLLNDHKEQFTKAALDDAEFARQEMPVAIVKRLLGHSVIRGLGNLDQIAADIEKNLQDWDTKLKSREAVASRLEESLKKYEIGFNFVGLADGFEALSKAKNRELWWTRIWLTVFGLLAVAPFSLELTLVFLNKDQLETLKWFFIVSSIPAVSLTLLLIYFFRVTLRNSESARAQLLQIELRKTLCRFIQSYAEYSAKLRKENPDALSKFENIIFSGIVATDEKLPSTFDGVDQIANVVKAIRGG